MRKGGKEKERGKRGDLRLSGDFISMAEEEDRRLLMPGSDICFRFMVDVERLSTTREEERQTREEGFTLEVGQWRRAFGCTQGRTRNCKIVIKGYMRFHYYS